MLCHPNLFTIGILVYLIYVSDLPNAATNLVFVLHAGETNRFASGKDSDELNNI